MVPLTEKAVSLTETARLEIRHRIVILELADAMNKGGVSGTTYAEITDAIEHGVQGLWYFVEQNITWNRFCGHINSRRDQP